MKKNAKEYLKDFASSQDDWLKALIYSAIDTNGDISRDRKNEIYVALRDSSNVTFTVPNVATSENEEKLILKTLHHKKGVNALQQDQKIKFHEDVTILYGMNGAGKSSYFKILNEVVGGNQRKDILPNIYVETPDAIDVGVSYERSGASTISWNGSTRSLDGFNSCKVFDTSYLNGLLETREADTTLIQPLGLNLFTYLIGLVDQYKIFLSDAADKEKAKKPTIDVSSLSENIKALFLNHKFNPYQKSNIEKLYDFSCESAARLSLVEKELQDFRQVNIKDKIRILSDEQGRFQNLIDWVSQKHTSLSKLSENATNCINDKKSKQVANNTAKEQFDVLKSIPANDTAEWKEFIVAGERYSKSLEGADDVCPYCWQELKTDNSVRTIQSFGLFLKDNTEQELNKAADALKEVSKAVEKLSLDLEVDASVEKVLQEKVSDSVLLSNLLKGFLENFQAFKSQLMVSINKENIETAVSLQDVSLFVTQLQAIKKELASKIAELTKEDSEKAQKIVALEQECKVLLENKSVSSQKDAIISWFSIADSESALRKEANSINSASLSKLSTLAHNELLTESLKQAFNEELNRIGHSNLGVEIESAGTKKGVSSTKLVLMNNNRPITAILSEGEQKAVALALFLAEIGMQKTSNPIILDDPVNSLDHKVAGNFAKRLLELDNQIILFNHNRFFLDFFETSKENHVCKSIDSACSKDKGKHIRIYEVISQGKSSKGILKNFKGNKAANHLREAKNLLQKIPFDENTKVATLLRQTVECVIDEVIFNNQVPSKFSNKNNRIGWPYLKEIKNDSHIIDVLEGIHGRVSGGEIHNGTEKYENPIDVDEFNKMISQLEGILAS